YGVRREETLVEIFTSRRASEFRNRVTPFQNNTGQKTPGASGIARAAQDRLRPLGDIVPRGVGTFINCDEVAQQKQAAHARDGEKLLRQRVVFCRRGVKETHRLLGDRPIQHKFGRIGVGCRLDFDDAKTHAADSASPLLYSATKLYTPETTKSTHFDN